MKKVELYIYISWEIETQATVVLSSTETEYQAMAAAVQEAIYLRALMKDLGYPIKELTGIGEDESVMHKRSKHIDTKLHFIREKVENKEVGIHYIPTEEMTAGILTKSLPRVEVEKRCVLGELIQVNQTHLRLLSVKLSLSVKTY
ncbi:Hypothetical predicted protein [Paramuricea clavata]|uniref:Uncharacterized protein n=1 Tax=Paramuricea clavata TaxID=317549 RepID=A0A7D9DPQ0_PARCT|nr:Hypothetical predicted protein [Paramuricea clavata]